MSSESTIVTAKSVPTPSVIGGTTLIKKSLSYRWVINDAKVLLENLGSECLGSLTSPVFSLLLPRKGSTRTVTSEWHLQIKKEKTFLVSLICQTSKSAYHLLITDDTLSILDLKTNEVKYSVIAPAKEFVINNYSSGSIELEVDLETYLDDHMLTLQVDAVILCFNESLETEVPNKNIEDIIKGLYQDDLFADATIVCGGKEFRVHKAILGSQSPVFRKMFEVDMKERHSGIIEISDTTSAVVSDLVAYLYTGTAPNINTLAKDLLHTANKYDLPRLVTMCERELKSNLTAGNAVEMLIFSELQKAKYLKQSCLEVIKNNCDCVLECVRASESWQDPMTTFTSDSHRISYSTLVEVLSFVMDVMPSGHDKN